MVRRWAWLAVLWTACGTDSAPPPPDPQAIFLSPTEHLSRASLALRGVRPSIAELEAVDTDPGLLPSIVDGYLSSAEFGATIRELHNQYLFMRVENFLYTPGPAGPIANKSFTEINASILDEPLRLIEDVVMSDQPYTNIVTAGYTMADDVVAGVWGLPRGPGGGWVRTIYPDGRDMAGILSTQAFYVRYRSTAFNYNRDRANAVSRGLLCHDYLDGDVKLDTSINLADPAVVATAVVKDPACAACHQTLDPLASYFFPYFRGVLPQPMKYPMSLYDPTQVATGWFLTNDRPPSYFGQDAVGIAGLGQAIANDPRFARCAAVHFAAYLTEVDMPSLPADWIAQLQQDFVDSGYDAKQLAKAVVLSDQFRIAGHGDPVVAESVVGYQKLRPQQLSRMLHGLTGFAWHGESTAPLGSFVMGPIDYLDDDFAGYRVLDGGIDSFYVLQPVHTMNAASSLVTRRGAYLAAMHVVTHDAAAPEGQRTLFTAADVMATDDASVRAELATLHGRIFGELIGADDPSIDQELALFDGVLDGGGDARRAWTITLTGMLEDLRAVYY